MAWLEGGGELPGVVEGERELGEEAQTLPLIAAAVRRMVWSETKKGKASGKVAAVRVHEAPVRESW